MPSISKLMQKTERLAQARQRIEDRYDEAKASLLQSLLPLWQKHAELFKPLYQEARSLGLRAADFDRTFGRLPMRPTLNRYQIEPARRVCTIWRPEMLAFTLDYYSGGGEYDHETLYLPARYLGEKGLTLMTQDAERKAQVLARYAQMKRSREARRKEENDRELYAALKNRFEGQAA